MDKCYDLPPAKPEKDAEQSLSQGAQSYYKDWKSAIKHIETSCPSLPDMEIDPKAKAVKWHDIQEKADVHNKELFAQVDTNHDARLSQNELNHALRHNPDRSVRDEKELEGAQRLLLARQLALGPLGLIPGAAGQVSLKEFMDLNRPVF